MGKLKRETVWKNLELYLIYALDRKIGKGSEKERKVTGKSN
ncbi:hypothetical protein ACO2KS_14265 [Leptospira terpstrae]